jgi:hypothetical protein
MEKSVVLSLRNDRATTARFHLEPWGESYEVEAGATVQVCASGPQDGELLLELGEGAITVYGWPGSVVRFRRSGIELTP